MPEFDMPAFQKARYIEFARKYALPANWTGAIDRFFQRDACSDCSYEFEFDFGSYLEDDRYIHIFTFDQTLNDGPQGGEDFYVFAIWLIDDRPLSECPIVASVWHYNDDDSCSPCYSQEVIVNNIEEFLRQLATGVAGWDYDTCRPNVIDPSLFKGLAIPFNSVHAAVSSVAAAARSFDEEELPRPHGWGSDD